MRSLLLPVVLRSATWRRDKPRTTSSSTAAPPAASRPPCRPRGWARRVVLIEPGQHLGGLTTGGLGATDIGNKQAIGGIAREFYRRVHQHYQQARRPGSRQTPDAVPSHGGRRDATSTPRPCGPSSRTWPRRSTEQMLARGQGAGASRRAAGPEGGRARRTARGSRPSSWSRARRLRRPDVHRRHLRRRPDGQGRRVVHRRPRGQRAVRRDAQRRAGRPARVTTSSSSRSIRTCEPGDPASGLLPGVHAGPPGRGRRGRPPRAGLLLPHVH